jgi:hypothetical protein
VRTSEGTLFSLGRPAAIQLSECRYVGRCRLSPMARNDSQVRARSKRTTPFSRLSRECLFGGSVLAPFCPKHASTGKDRPRRFLCSGQETVKPNDVRAGRSELRTQALRPELAPRRPGHLEPGRFGPWFRESTRPNAATARPTTLPRMAMTRVVAAKPRLIACFLTWYRSCHHEGPTSGKALTDRQATWFSDYDVRLAHPARHVALVPTTRASS